MHYQSVLSLVGALALFNGGVSAAALNKRGAAPASPGISSSLPSGFTYQGCFVDSPSNRQLTGDCYVTSDMTQEKCINHCISKGYPHAGVEYGTECYCGYQSTDAPVQVADSECSMACGGDSTEACGGPGRMTVFTNGAAAPVTNPGTNGADLVGCYSDTQSTRTLPNQINVPGLTVAKCIDACTSAGYEYSGVEYSSECFCGSKIGDGAHIIHPGGCDMVCAGNSGEYCGGAGTIDVYRVKNFVAPTAPATPAGWSALGCYTDKTSARTLSFFSNVAGGMTIESCLSSCKTAGYSLAGVEFGRECFCDNTIENGATLYSDSSVCHYPCSGNPSETCGGADAINIYSM